MLSHLFGLLLNLRPDAISLNRDLDFARPLWVKEASKQIDRPVVLLVHGGDIGGQWFVFPDSRTKKQGGTPLPADALVSMVKWVYPDRPLVLCSCNRAAHDLTVPGVYYTKRIVWCRPGNDWRLDGLWPDRGTGSIKGFIRR